MPKGHYIRKVRCTRKNIIEHFEENFIPEPNTGCWLWLGYGDNRSGRCYGHLRVDGKMALAHRFAYEMTFGSIPEGLCCLHKCDTPECVNPNHLFLGTRIDNNNDMMNKKRNKQPKGIGNGRAKLSEEDVIKIRSDNRKLSIIAKEYNVFYTLISHIKLRQIWKHI